MLKRFRIISRIALLTLLAAIISLVGSSSIYAASMSPRGAHVATVQKQADASGNLVHDGGFENQTTNTVSAPWGVEGAGSQGIDRNLGFAHSDSNNAWIRTDDQNWHSLIQAVAVQPNTNYTLTG